MGKKAENSTRNRPFAIGTYRFSLYTEKGKKAIDATGSPCLDMHAPGTTAQALLWDCVQAVFVDSLQEKEYNFLIQAVRKTLRGVRGTAAPLTLNCIQRDRALILLAKSIPDQFGRLLVG